MRQSCDMFSSDADEDLDPAMEENVAFLSLSIGGSKSSCPSDNSVGLDGFFTDEDESFDDRQEFLTTGGNENPGHCAVGNVSDDVPRDHPTQHDAVNGKANLEISIPDNVCEKNRPVKGSRSHACATGASVFSGFSSPAPCGSKVKTLSQPIDIVYANGSAESEWGHDRTEAAWRRANRQLFSDAKAREDWREKAWERKRDQVLLEGFCHDDMSDQSKTLAHQEFGEVVIDSPRTQKQALKGGPRARNYLTNVDIDELKGCLDLGFGFNYEEMPELSHTLPALELCYAIGQNFQDHDHQKSSPVSTLDGADSAHCDSYAQSPIANWKISSPGDSPQEVKARLKVWAQAVACTVRLCS